MHQKPDFDIIIIGGGVAGLWTLNHLRKQGYQAILLEKATLGGGQTNLAQGIIHGGVKYALKGHVTEAAQAIAAMPQVWQACLSGEGDLDLRTAQILSHSHYLWSTSALTSRMGAFLASKVLSSHSSALKREQFPAVFQHPAFKGQVYQVSETVVHIQTLVPALAAPVWDAIFKAPSIHIALSENNERIAHVALQDLAGTQHCLTAKRYLFTAGEGNEALLANLSNAPVMQRRPLHMVSVTSPHLSPLFAHCVVHQSTPRLTVTSHPVSEGACWYLGGQLAEEGVARDPAAQITVAQAELASLFPWLDLNQAQWRSFRVNRAEAKQANGQKPDASTVFAQENWLVGWPTKLAFAPQLAKEVYNRLQYAQVTPGEASGSLAALSAWEKPAFSVAAWEQPC